MLGQHKHHKKVLHEVRDAVVQLGRNRETVLRERELALYDRCMNRLKAVGMDVTEYEIGPELYLRNRPGVSYVGSVPSGRRVSYKDFDVRARVLLGTLNRHLDEIQYEESRMKNLPVELIENRKVLLSLLIDTFLQTRDQIPVFYSDGGLTLLSVDTRVMEFEPTTADLVALEQQGLISLTYGADGATPTRITIPTATLNLFQNSSAMDDAVSGSDRQKAIQNHPAVVNNFHGNVGNVATNSSDFQQTAHIETMDQLEQRIRQLNDVLLTASGVDTLIAAAKADAEDAGKPTWGARVGKWAADVSSGAATDYIVAGTPRVLAAVLALFS